MFGTDPTLMGAKEPTFQKRSYQMSKFQFSFLHRDVSIAGRFQSAVAKPIVGSNATSSHDSFLHEGCETVSRCILKNTKANSPKAFILLVFYSNSYKYFACSPTSSFAWLLSANKGFIYFNHTRQTVTARTHHGATQFMQPCPSRAIASQTKYTFQPECTGPIFLPGYPPYRPKPDRQRLVSVLKNRPRDYRQLVMATGALVQCGSNRPCFETATSWTGEAVWPSQAIKVVSTSLFRRKPSLKFGQTLGVLLHAPLYYI